MAVNGSGRTFLQRAARYCPDLKFIPEVERVYAEMGRLWNEQMGATGGSFNVTKKTLRSKELKQPIADFIHHYSDCCDDIVEIYRANGYGVKGEVRGGLGAWVADAGLVAFPSG